MVSASLLVMPSPVGYLPPTGAAPTMPAISPLRDTLGRFQFSVGGVGSIAVQLAREVGRFRCRYRTNG